MKPIKSWGLNPIIFPASELLPPRILDINRIIEDMLKMLQRLIGEDIELVWPPGTCVRTVRMDSSQVDQLMVNLCLNARDAIKDIGRVTIEICWAMNKKSKALERKKTNENP